MATTINVNLGSVTGIANSNSGSTSQVAAIKKQIAALQKQLQDLQKSKSDNATEQAQLIQQQIVVLEAKLAQLESEKSGTSIPDVNGSAMKTGVTHNSSKTEASAAKTTSSTLGMNVDEYA